MVVYITRNIVTLEILQDAGESVYLLPFIWWEKMELGDILIAA